METTYQLVLEISRRIRISPGKLGTYTLQPGRYVYTGSAKKAMDARIARHCKRDKIKRWHIDWLTSHSAVKIAKVSRSSKSECNLNQSTAGRIVIDRFGASDCKNGCKSHLKQIS